MNNFNFKTDLVPKNIESAIKIALVFFIIYTCFLIFKPFILPVIWAIIIAVALNPVHEKLNNLFKDKPSISASLITIVALKHTSNSFTFFYGSFNR